MIMGGYEFVQFIILVLYGRVVFFYVQFNVLYMRCLRIDGFSRIRSKF